MVKPPSFDPAQKYPLILEIHGGPHGNYNSGSTDRSRTFAANGFVVLYTNPRGSTGYGTRVRQRDHARVSQRRLRRPDGRVDTRDRPGLHRYQGDVRGGCSGGGVLSSWVIGTPTGSPRRRCAAR
jgi:hypothetical protein